jgi:hypothetical protein
MRMCGSRTSHTRRPRGGIHAFSGRFQARFQASLTLALHHRPHAVGGGSTVVPAFHVRLFAGLERTGTPDAVLREPLTPSPVESRPRTEAPRPEQPEEWRRVEIADAYTRDAARRALAAASSILCGRDFERAWRRDPREAQATIIHELLIRSASARTRRRRGTLPTASGDCAGSDCRRSAGSHCVIMIVFVAAVVVMKPGMLTATTVVPCAFGSSSRPPAPVVVED